MSQWTVFANLLALPPPGLPRADRLLFLTSFAGILLLPQSYSKFHRKGYRKVQNKTLEKLFRLVINIVLPGEPTPEVSFLRVFVCFWQRDTSPYPIEQ
jgi:hypothetical protein